MVKELSIVSSMVIMLISRISRERSSRVEIIFTTCPGILGETVLRRRFGPENLTSTSATGDLELATSSLAESLREELEEDGVGERSIGVDIVGDISLGL